MKKSYLIIIIVLLLVLTAVNVWLFLRSKSCCEKECCANKEQACYLTRTLDLSSAQSQKYEEIKVQHQAVAAQIADSLHHSQDLLMNYMQVEKYNEDSVLKFAETIQRFQMLLLQQSIKQYYDVKSILTNEQIPSLDSIYRHILVCRPSCKYEVQLPNSHTNIKKE